MNDKIEQVNSFLRSHVGKLGISSIVLAGFEKIIDSDFACPCQPGYNECICALYAIVPFFVSGIFAFFQDSEQEDNLKNKVLYSLLTGLIWLFFFFIDGRYVACAGSHWGGEYTETGALKWCKPKGNETEVLKRQQETLMWDTISQIAALGTALVTAIIFGILKWCGGPVQKKEKKSSPAEEARMDVRSDPRTCCCCIDRNDSII